MLFVIISIGGRAQHFNISRLVFDNLVFADPEAKTFYDQKKDITGNNTELIIPTLKTKYSKKQIPPTDEVSINILSSYTRLERNQVYEALRYYVSNEANLNKINLNELVIANKVMAGLIYEKQAAYRLACAELYNLNSRSLVENYQIDAYVAYLRFKDEDYQEAYVYFKRAATSAKKISLVDEFYCLTNLSKTCNELGLHKEQLQCALRADSLINSDREDFFNSNISYELANNSVQEIMESLHNQSLISLSVAYRKNKRYMDALGVLNKLIEIKKGKNTAMLSEVYINKALTYTFLKDYEGAAIAYYEALKLDDLQNNSFKRCEIYNLLAKNNYLSQDYVKAVTLCETSLDLAKKNSDYQNTAASYYILSETYARNSDYVSSKKYLKLYTDTKEMIEKQRQDRYSVAKSKNNDTEMLAKKAKSDILESEKQLLEDINLKMSAEQKEKEFLLLKKENELKEKDLVNQRLEKDQIERNLVLLKEQLEREQLQKKYIQLSREKEIEQLERKNNENEIKLLNTQKEVFIRENELKTSELEASKSRTQILLGASLVLLLLLISLVLFLIKINKQKQTIELYNLTIQKTNHELENNVRQVTQQKLIIEEKNKEILDSISYAQRIQGSLLLKEEGFEEFFAESFALFLPKEIVSGDFYLVKRRGNEIFIAVVDCTGHGVPGAMIAALAYQEIVHLIDTTKLNLGGILDALNERIHFLLNTNNLIGSDGMDMILLCVNKADKIINYAGAKSSFLLSHNNELTEFKTDKKSIGQDLKKDAFVFNTFNLAYSPQDIIYLYTDGFADQFSELDHKRIGSKRFKSTIASVSNLSLGLQKIAMNEFLAQHKRAELQTDDITLIAIKLL